MKNVVFIDIDKLGIGFQENIEELNNFKNNLLDIASEDLTSLYFVSKKKLEDAKYQAALIMNYFNIVFRDNDNLEVNYLLTKDVVTDLGLNNEIALIKDSGYISEKEVSIINNIGANNINTLFLLDDAFSFELWRAIEQINTVIVFEGHKDSLTPIKKVDNTTMMYSNKSGISGFNDCLESYNQGLLLNKRK